MREPDIFDVLCRIDDEAIPATDRLMWELLTENGYDVRRLAENPTERRIHALEVKMKKRREHLEHEAQIDRERGIIRFRYVLVRRGDVVAKSRWIMFVRKEEEGQDGEQRD